MSEPIMQEIEINGIKMQVDLRYATRIETIKVGTKVKVLTKDYSGHKVQHGVVIGFEPFQELPTIIVAHVEIGYSATEIKFLYFNKASKDVEIVVAYNEDEYALDKENILKALDRDIAKKEREIEDIQSKRQYFLDKFATYWEPEKQAA